MDLSAALSLIRHTSRGKRLLEALEPLLASGGATIRALGPSELARLGRPARGKPASGFMYQGGVREILLDPRLEPGLLAPVLFHEAVHATDELFIKAYAGERALWQKFEARSADILRAVAARARVSVAALTTDLIHSVELAEMRALRDRFEEYQSARHFNAERRAYGELHAFVQELSEALPGYREFLQSKRAVGFAFDRRVSDDEIREAYTSPKRAA